MSLLNPSRYSFGFNPSFSDLVFIAYVSINELRVLIGVSIKLNPTLFCCEDHEDWFAVHYLGVDCSCLNF